MRMVNVVVRGTISSRARARINYVIDFLNEHPISVDKGFNFKTNIPGFFDLSLEVDAQSALLNHNDVVLNLKQFKLGDKEVFGTVVKGSENLSLDIIGSIFFHLSRYEELLIKSTDYLSDKLMFENQLQVVRSGIEKRPIVDELISAYIETLTKKKVDIPIRRVLSHDIDHIQKFKYPFSILRKIAGHIKHRKSVKGFSKLWSSYVDYLVRGRDSFDTFDWMLSKLEMEKTIYFLMGGNHANDSTYSSENKTFRKAVSLARERGYDFGIHPSYESYNRSDQISEEKERLESVVGHEIVRSRQHFLNFDILETPKILQSLGIREDSSLGFTKYTGYRCGTAFPFKLYDFENEQAFDVVEKPLVFMDSAWLHESLRQGEFDASFMESCNGVLNFHNSTFDEMHHRNFNMEQLYKALFSE